MRRGSDEMDYIGAPGGYDRPPSKPRKPFAPMDGEAKEVAIRRWWYSAGIAGARKLLQKHQESLVESREEILARWESEISHDWVEIMGARGGRWQFCVVPPTDKLNFSTSDGRVVRLVKDCPDVVRARFIYRNEGEEMTTKIDLSLKNSDLYNGCQIEEVAGRLNLTTPVADAVNLVGRNVEAILHQIEDYDKDIVTLTGPMAVWSYLIVFHAVVHRFREVRYDDGRSGPVTVAKHG